MVALPREPAGRPTHSAGGGSWGGVPFTNTGPSPAFRSANAAVARTTCLPSQARLASPNAVVLPLRSSDVRTSANPAVPGRRKNPEITIGSGNGMTSPRALAQMASM
jgi:hypothetical protein